MDMPATVTDSLPSSRPLPPRQRINALDIVRGFALIGICIMNVDFFNRPIGGLGTGIPAGLTGLNWLAAWFNAYFVVGKFWTIFSLLFGMGFAVMLQQAQDQQRPFMKVYLRRILALGVIGAVHHIFIWPGDILFSYAMAALGLLLVLFASWRVFAGLLVLLIGLAFVPGMKPAGDFAVMVALCGLFSLYMRHPRVYTRFNLSAAMVSWFLLAVAGAVSIAMVVSWFVPAMKEARVPLSILTPLLFAASWASIRFYAPADLRRVRTGVFMYGFFMTVGLCFATVEHFFPEGTAAGGTSAQAAGGTRAQSTGGTRPQAAAPVPATSAISATSVVQPAPAAPASAAAVAQAGSAVSVAPASAAAQAKPVDKAAERKAQRAKRIMEREQEKATEAKILRHGSYAEALKIRWAHFVRHATGDAGFSVILIGMFLIGSWFVQAGVIQNPGAHLPLLRRLAMIGLPVGIGMGMAGGLIATTAVPGVQNGWGIAWALLGLGNLPASLGYVALIVLLLHRAGGSSRLNLLAPFGRMALTHYLMQSIIASLIFYNYGLGWYGMERAAQFGYVAVLIPLQIALSHWWLSKYRYGPAEWLWRAVTYWQLPPFRLATPAAWQEPGTLRSHSA